MGLYRLLLRLLPKTRRERYEDQMVLVFADLVREARGEAGVLGTGLLLMRETGGLVKFAVRERFTRLRARFAARPPAPKGGRPDFRAELRWAWRGVRSRGWTAGLTVALMAVALCANTLVFSIADSAVFNPVPYRDVDRLVRINRSLAPTELEAWRQQADLFAGMEGYLTKTVFVMIDGRSELVRTADVTPGLIDLLGVKPRWGRPFVEDDARASGAYPVLISYELARRYFGRPDVAPGRQVETTGIPLLVVGVMPSDFRFPNGSMAIWRALDPRGPLTPNLGSVSAIARMVPDMTIPSLNAAMRRRTAGIAAAPGSPATQQVTAESYSWALPSSQRTPFYVLLGAAVCLLLIACANVASLELASALRRARTHAVHLALGATRASLARVAIIEGAILIGLAAGIGGGLTLLGLDALSAALPDRLRLGVNPLDLDRRTFLFMIVGAAVTWALVSLPGVAYASRSSVMRLLKGEHRGSSVSGTGARLRRVLTITEIALAVLLVIAGALYLQSYRKLLGIDKGIDATNLVEVSLTLPPIYPSSASVRGLAQELIQRATRLPGVLAAAPGSAPPSPGNAPTGGLHLEIDGQAPLEETISLATNTVDPAFLKVLGLPLKGGRMFEPGDPPTNVIVPEAFARRFWAEGAAVGHTFRPSPKLPVYFIVGVIADFRVDARQFPQSSDPSFFIYSPAQPPPPPTPPRPGWVDTGGMYRFIDVTIRLDSRARATAVLDVARQVDPRVQMTLEFVDEMYANQHADVLLTTRIVSAFGALAFLVAIAGVYGVMAFLVAGRTREIGIRMALGAERRDISRLVLRSAGTMVATGAIAGAGAALLASRWMASQFFGVTPTEPLTYLAVTGAIVATAVVATWQPAKLAARVDPAITLRAE